MEITNLFEQASRNKTRFNFKGSISTEDLWDLSLNNLDSIFKSLNKTIKANEGESLLNKVTEEDKNIKLKIDIIKHIVNVKLQEENEKENALILKKEKRKLLEIIAEKEDINLKNKSLDELKAMVNNM